MQTQNIPLQMHFLGLYTRLGNIYWYKTRLMVSAMSQPLKTILVTLLYIAADGSPRFVLPPLKCKKAAFSFPFHRRSFASCWNGGLDRWGEGLYQVYTAVCTRIRFAIQSWASLRTTMAASAAFIKSWKCKWKVTFMVGVRIRHIRVATPLQSIPTQPLDWFCTILTGIT